MSIGAGVGREDGMSILLDDLPVILPDRCSGVDVLGDNGGAHPVEKGAVLDGVDGGGVHVRQLKPGPVEGCAVEAGLAVRVGFPILLGLA